MRGLWVIYVFSFLILVVAVILQSYYLEKSYTREQQWVQRVDDALSVAKRWEEVSKKWQNNYEQLRELCKS